MSPDFRRLASFVETRAPEDYATLRAQHPSAGILAAAKKLGGAKGQGDTVTGSAVAPAATQRTPNDEAAAQDFCRVGLRVVREGADKLMKRVRGRMRSARRFRIGGAVLAMASSAGFAASVLDLLNVDHKLAGLVLSSIGFLGGLGALSSDELTRGGPPGADGRSLFDRLVNLQALIASATLRFEGQGADARFDTLSALDTAAGELTKLQALYSVA